MKIFSFVLTTCFCFTMLSANAQEITYKAIFGLWEYDSPMGKLKLSYNFAKDKKFTSLTEFKAAEQKTVGNFQLEKKGKIDRLKLITSVQEFKTKTHVTYYLIKFLGLDTLKSQKATSKQAQWESETPENTMIFVRKKEKPKDK